MNKKLILSASIVILVVLAAGGVGYYIWQDISNRAPIDSETAPPGEESENNGTAVITEVEAIDPAISVPILNRPIVIAVPMSEAQKQSTKAHMESVIAELREEATLYNNWLELGVYRKLIGDYEGAEEIWKFMTVHWTDDPVSYSNLANLYREQLQDLSKAETYSLLAIEKAPHLFNYYYHAYELYRFVLKNDAKAREILMKGKERNPAEAEFYDDLLLRF